MLPLVVLDGVENANAAGVPVVGALYFAVNRLVPNVWRWAPRLACSSHSHLCCVCSAHAARPRDVGRQIRTAGDRRRSRSSRCRVPGPRRVGPVLAVRPEGANHQWRSIPLRKLTSGSAGQLAGLEPPDKGHPPWWLSDPSKVGLTVGLELPDEPTSLSHLPAHVRHSHDAAEPRKVTRGRRKSSGGALRSLPPALARRGLSHARLADRSGRCRAGSLAAAEPLRYHRR